MSAGSDGCAGPQRVLRPPRRRTQSHRSWSSSERACNGRGPVAQCQVGRVRSRANLGQLYAWRTHGVCAPPRGLRHDPTVVLLDPYGKAVAVPAAYDRFAARRANRDAGNALKSVVVDMTTIRQGLSASTASTCSFTGCALPPGLVRNLAQPREDAQGDRAEAGWPTSSSTPGMSRCTSNSRRSIQLGRGDGSSTQPSIRPTTAGSLTRDPT